MLKHKEDIRTLAFVALYFAVTIFSWFTFSFKWYIFVPILIINCTLSFICATIIHNTIHVPIFKSKTLNKFFQVVLTFTHGHPVSGFVPGHNLSHHKYLLTNKDGARPEKMHYSWNLLNQLLFMFSISGAIMRDENRFFRKMYKQRPVWARQYILEFGLVFIVKIILTIFDWQKALFLLWLPHFYATWGILGTNFWQHDGCDGTHPYNHSRTFTSKLFNFLVFNNGYHGAHHQKPNLHWSKYPDYHKEFVEPHLHPNLNLNSFLAYIIKAYVYPGKRVDYLSNPIPKPVAEKDGDWVADVQSSEVKSDLGAA